MKIYKDLPFEEGKTYQTKFATGEKFLLKKIIWTKGKKPKIYGFEGIYENSSHLGICPLGENRLIVDKVEIEDFEVCDKCKQKI